MKVFITGASGYIGAAVAAAFRRAGHQVTGLVRGADKAAQLARQEIRPVIGTLQAPDTWLDAAAEASVLVHAAVDYQADIAELDRRTVEVLLGLGGPRTLIYTSGVWVNGDSAWADETMPPAPTALVAARPEVERRVLAAGGIVIRPGVVYGRRGGLTALWFAGAAEGRIKVVGDGHNRWSTVHVDDLADLYLRAGERPMPGEIFNGTDGAASTVNEMVAAIAGAAPAPVTVEHQPIAAAREAMGALFADALALDQRIDSGKAERLLGWRPRFRGLVPEAKTCFEAWKAGRRV